ncbi:MAG: hypothetical protein ACUVTG_06695 [Candidatus Oleimicrobiaceae bacterium]
MRRIHHLRDTRRAVRLWHTGQTVSLALRTSVMLPSDLTVCAYFNSVRGLYHGTVLAIHINTRVGAKFTQ